MPSQWYLRFRVGGGVTAARDLGAHIHALVFQMIADASEELAQKIHSLKGKRPFTVSGVMDGHLKRFVRNLRFGREYAIRLTLLSEELEQALLQRWARGRPDPGQLSGVPIDIVEISSQPSREAPAICSYAELLFAQKYDEFLLRFTSPTTLRRKSKNFPLPDPEGLFQGYAAKWNMYSPVSLDTERALASVGNGGLVINRHSIKTQSVQIKGVPQVGFVGDVSFKVLSKEAACDILTLARFAQYAGSGYKTAMGMGQTMFLLPEC